MKDNAMSDEGCSNLPKWPGASQCYSRANRLLQYMADHCVPERDGIPIRPFRRPLSWIVCTPDMQSLIDALNAGDEETIKGLLLHHDAVSKVD
jgi:hypothetical protein